MNEAEAAMLSGLRDIRLPAEAAGGLPADIAAVLAFAGLAALAAAVLVRLFSQRRVRIPPKSLAAEVKQVSILPPDARRLALLRLLKTHAPERFAALRPSLYRPGHTLDAEQLEAQLRDVA